MRLTIKNLHKMIGRLVETEPEMELRVMEIDTKDDSYRFRFTDAFRTGQYDIWLWRDGHPFPDMTGEVEIFYNFETMPDNIQPVGRAADFQDMDDVCKILGRLLLIKYFDINKSKTQ